MLKIGALVTLVTVAASPAMAQEATLLSRSQKLASALMESRTCEVVPENGFTKCHYSYQGLHFTRLILPHTKPRSVFVVIDSQELGAIQVSFAGGPCMMIGVGSDDPEEVTAVYFNVKEGKFYLNSREGRARCRP